QPSISTSRSLAYVTRHKVPGIIKAIRLDRQT
ncbi:unnamed protein product, partial [marine sediment metagenome]